MLFAQFCTLFDHKLDKLMRAPIIATEDIASASGKFAKFAEFDLGQKEVTGFVNSVYNYFLFVIKYAKHFDEVTFHQHQLSVKTALDTFLFVVDKTDSYTLIIKRLQKIIDKLIEQFGQLAVVQELLRVYVGCLSNVVRNVLETLANRHKFIYLLPQVARDAHETSTQAVIVDLFLKLFSVKEPRLEQMFPEITKIAHVINDNGNNYQNIRMVLQELNAKSNKIFSIDCRKIMLDHSLVTEFEGANSVNEVWLDVDLSCKKMSFFCTPDFLAGFTNTKFGVATNWEVLSFYVQDCIDYTFSYNKANENLEIDIKILISKFNLFRNFQFDTIRHLLIHVSKYSKKYNEFVMIVLPQVFARVPSEELAEVINEDDSTVDLILESPDDSASPVIEHFSIKKVSRYSEDSRVVNKTISNISNGSLINLLTDDEDEIPRQNDKVSTRKTVTRVSTAHEINIGDKSITPISFSESLFGRPRPSRISTMKENKKTRKSKKAKASTSCKREPRPLKISTKPASLTIHSANVDTPIRKEVDEAICNLIDDDIIARDMERETLELSQSKVENWLSNRFMSSKTGDSPVLEENSEFKLPNEPLVPSLGTPISNISSNQPLEQRITRWLDERRFEGSPTVRQIITQKLSGRTESLLETLAKDIKTDVDLLTENVVEVPPSIEIDLVENTQRTPKASEKEIQPTDVVIQEINENKECSKNPELVDNAVEEAEAQILMDNNENQIQQKHADSIGSDDSNIPLAQLLVHWKEKTVEKYETQNSIIANVNIIEYGDISSDSENEKGKKKKRESVSKQQISSDSITKIGDNNEKLVQHPEKIDTETEQRTVVPSANNLFLKKQKISVVPIKTLITKAGDRKGMPRISEEKSLNEEVEANKENNTPGNKIAQNESLPERQIPASEAIDNNINFSPSISNHSEKQPDTSELIKPKRRLYNPNDLSYLQEENLTEENNSKDDKASPVEVIEIKDKPRRRSSTKRDSTQKKKRKKTINDSDLTELKTPKKKGEIAANTELTFEKVFNSFKKARQEHKEQKKIKQLEVKSKAKRGRKPKPVLSCPSEQSSPEPFGVPLEALLGKRKCSFAGKNSMKRMKKSEEASKGITVLSNIVIKQADSQQSESPNQVFGNSGVPRGCFCGMFAKSMNKAYLDLITHLEACNTRLFQQDDFFRIVNILKRYID